MSAARIYRSQHPDYVIPRQSVYSKLFPNESWYDESLPAYIEATAGRTLTRADVRDLTLRVGHGVRNLLKTRRGDTVMLFSPNSLTWPLALLGCVAAGLRCTLANSSYTPPELAHQLKDSGAGYVFVHPALVPTLFKAFEVLKVPVNEAKKRVILMNFGEKPPKGMEQFIQFDSLLKGGKLSGEERFDGDQSDETVYLCYSSGTTGLSKGVETTHHNINTVLTCCRAVFPGMYPGKDVMLGILPFYHIYGAVKLVHYPFTLGVPVVISPPFNPEELDRSRTSAIKKRGANVVVTQGYGLTETSPTCLLLNTTRAEDKVGSAGELLPNMEARLVGEDGHDVKDGEPGEFWLRGPSVMKGYLNNPTATRNSITPDGWFKTGDIAVRDKDGFFTVVDRLKELIKYKGFQVPPADLENVLLTHPDVVDAGVIGIYSEEQATELPRAYVVHRAGFASLSKSQREAFAREVQTWIQGKVAKHKFLRGGVAVVEVIPKSAAGKILRRQLRDLAKTEMAEAGVKAKL
ncbi:AMP binding enzyme [Ceratobasidium sp. AG-Ba]|nr:AMP binding enzyme [Ceratobasidium sp. AG-Ba]